MKHIQAGRRIVIGVDGSAASVAGLRWAVREADLREAELHAVYAWDGPERPRAPYAAISGLPSLDDDRAAAAALLAGSLRAAFGLAPQIPLRAELVEGRAERVLLDRAVGAELLVLGSTWQPDQLQHVAGPVHRACLRGAPCPVVVVGYVEGLVTHDPKATARPPVGAGAGAQG
jgi:nucleotide-binding universal stress UspA family protein